jgi:hypothetical protein
MLCAGVMSCEALRILLKRGKPRCIPEAFHFDPYNREYVRSRRARMTSGLFRRLVRWVAMRRFPSMRRLHTAERAARAGRADAWRRLYSGPGFTC